MTSTHFLVTYSALLNAVELYTNFREGILRNMKGLIATAGKRKRRGTALRHPRCDPTPPSELGRIKRRRGVVAAHEELLADVALEEANLP